MKRAIFLYELQRALALQVSIVVALVLAVGLSVYWGVPIPPLVNLLLIIMVSTGGVAGSFPFARTFQEKQWPLLVTLPVDRGAAWSLIAAAHAAAALLSIAAIPALLSAAYATPIVSIPLIVLYWTCFSAAMYASLAAPSDLSQFRLTQLAPLPLALVFFGLHFNVVVQIWYIALTIGLFPRDRVTGAHIGRFADSVRQADLYFAIFANVLFVAGYLMLARYIFIRGENRLLKIRIRFFLLSTAYVVLLALLLPAIAGAFVAWDTWRLDTAVTSVDGSYAAILERGARHPSRGRLTVIDLHSGAVLGRAMRDGIRSITWTRRGSELNVLAEERPLRAFFVPAVVRLHPRNLDWLPSEDVVTTFSHDLQEVADFRAEEIADIWAHSNGNVFLVTHDEGTGAVLSRKPGTDLTETVATGPLLGYVHYYRAGNSTILDFRNVSKESSLWTIGDDMRELKWATSKTDMRPRYIIDDTIYTMPSSARDAVAERVPPPGPPNGVGAYLISSVGGNGRAKFIGTTPGFGIEEELSTRALYVDLSTRIFYMLQNGDAMTGSLFAFDEGAHAWKLLDPTIPLQDDTRKFIASGQVLAAADALQSLRVDSQNAVIVYVTQRDGKLIVRLADGRAQKVIDLGETDKAAAKIELRSVDGFNGVLISFGTKAAMYMPGSGNPVSVSLGGRSPRDLLFLATDGTQIYQDREAGRLIQKSANRSERVLWPQ